MGSPQTSRVPQASLSPWGSFRSPSVLGGPSGVFQVLGVPQEFLSPWGSFRSPSVPGGPWGGPSIPGGPLGVPQKPLSPQGSLRSPSVLGGPSGVPKEPLNPRGSLSPRGSPRGICRRSARRSRPRAAGTRATRRHKPVPGHTGEGAQRGQTPPQDPPNPPRDPPHLDGGGVHPDLAPGHGLVRPRARVGAVELLPRVDVDGEIGSVPLPGGHRVSPQTLFEGPQTLPSPSPAPGVSPLTIRLALAMWCLTKPPPRMIIPVLGAKMA